MNFERSFEANRQPSLDEEWFERYQVAGNFEAFDYLGGSKDYREEERRKFESGEEHNPRLDYPDLSFEDFDQRDKTLMQLKTEILEREENEVVRQAWRWRLNEKIAETRMLKAAARGDMRKFKKYNEYIYGAPSEDVFAYTVAQIREKLQAYKLSDNAVLRESALDLELSLPEGLTGEGVSELPDSGLLEQAKQITLEQLGDLIEINESSSEQLESSQIKEFFSRALNVLKADGWSVVIDKDRTGISVRQEKKSVVIPESRQLLVEKLKSLVLHEIGTHVARRVNGERSKLKLLALGLDRYDAGEEGVATMREQALSGGVTDYAGLEGHFAISLAKGLDGKPRDFRDVFEVLEKYYFVKLLAEGKLEEDARQSAKDNAWARCVRTFRGSDCATAGACFTKDIVYREGNIGVWSVMRSNPQEAVKFNLGKYNPANVRHLWILEQLGITEEDLTHLEEA